MKEAGGQAMNRRSGYMSVVEPHLARRDRGGRRHRRVQRRDDVGRHGELPRRQTLPNRRLDVALAAAAQLRLLELAVDLRVVGSSRKRVINVERGG